MPKHRLRRFFIKSKIEQIESEKPCKRNHVGAIGKNKYSCLYACHHVGWCEKMNWLGYKR